MTRGGEVAKLMAPLLTELSFRKRAGAILTCELGSDRLGWLGLNTAVEHRRPGEVEVNPVVGVRHQAVERIVSECRGVKFHQYVPPTVRTPIGYLFPEARYRSWIFGSEDSDAAVANELRDAIHDHALPFIRATASLPELCSRVDQAWA